MNERRKQQIIKDKDAQETLRAMGVEISLDEHRTPSQILEQLTYKALKETVETVQDGL